MKILQISNGKANFIDKEGNYKEIIDIDKEALYYLGELALNEEVTMDEEIEPNQIIVSEIAKIIYANILKQMKKLQEQKETVLHDINSKYEGIIQSYSEELKESN